MNNEKFFQSFFTEAKKQAKYGNLSYNHQTFFSYSTAIGEVSETTDGRRVLILSSEKMSMTTARHIRDLFCASPLPVVFLPNLRGNKEFYAFDILSYFSAKTENNYKLTQKKERDRLSADFEMVKNALKIEKFRPFFPEFKKLFTKLKKMAAIAVDPEKIKAEKAKAAEKAKKARLALKNKLN